MYRFDAHGHLAGLIRRAIQQTEGEALAGLSEADVADLGGLAYDRLEADLVEALERVRELKGHAHQWQTDEESGRTTCLVCGADGDA